MVNSELSEISYVIQSGVTTYPIGFEYHFNENNSPQLLVKIGESVAIINVDFQLSSDESEIILIPTEEEAKAQTSPNDTRWMDRIVGKELLITRDIPFVQTSDYSVGRINPEQIEYDFDRSVMRDQEILNQLGDLTVEVAQVESLANAAVETANEAVTTANKAVTAANQAATTANTALTASGAAIRKADEAKATATQASKDAVDAMAEAASAVNKADAADATATTAMEVAAEAVTLAQSVYSKKEVDDKITVINADIDANADAIQKTRADFIEADSDIHTILNNHAGELTTLHNDVDNLGDQVSGIESKIPESASDTNQLATKADLEGLGGGDFLPLSGGTLTGQLLIDVGESPTTVGATRAFAFTGTADGIRRTCWFAYTPQYYRLDVNSVHVYNIGHITPHADGEQNIGSSYNKFNTVYTNQISSASSKAITIPALSGTMARIEDIDAIGGDGTEGQVLTKTADGMAWQDASGGTGGGDYLPLAGGTITGPLSINSKGYNEPPILVDGFNELQIGYHSTITDKFITVFRFSLGNGAFLPYANNLATLGGSTRIWKTAFVANLNNGADLNIPTEGGTLARIEDIDAIGGDGTAGQVLTKTDEGMAWQDASGGDYLPLAGGEMSGPIAFSGTDYSIKYDESKHGVVIYTNAARGFVFSNSGYGTFYSTSYNADLGHTGYTWRRVYARIINNGADLAIPTVGGTLARVEDIDAVVGDISTALTAILGE